MVQYGKVGALVLEGEQYDTIVETNSTIKYLLEIFLGDIVSKVSHVERRDSLILRWI